MANYLRINQHGTYDFRVCIPLVNCHAPGGPVYCGDSPRRPLHVLDSRRLLAQRPRLITAARSPVLLGFTVIMPAIAPCGFASRWIDQIVCVLIVRQNDPRPGFVKNSPKTGSIRPP